MKTHILAAFTLVLMSGAAAYAQPHDDHRGGPPGAHGPANPVPGFNARPAPAMNNRPMAPAPMRGNPPGRGGPAPAAFRHHLPPGLAAPHGHDRAPMWHGRSWAVGDPFYFGGFNGPTIRDVNGYGLPPARPGTHWIYTDGWFLMVGNRTGKIFTEVAADY